MPSTKRAPRAAGPSAMASGPPISRSTEKLKAILDTMPGARAEPVPTPRGAPTPAVMYKLMGKMFAILSVRGDAFVIVKCDPALVDHLRQTYRGVGHRSHLDSRFWISIELDADVPMAEARKLIAGSYDLIHEKLTRKQKEELAALMQSKQN
jgi:predicted DNA-binding protein (MmcQ/YjbR family)